MKRRLSITLHEVSVRRGGRWALRGVSWPLRPGECWALLGDNGSGKTQLLKLLSGAVWPTPDERRARKSGRTYFRGGESVPLIDAKAHVAYVGGESQDKYSRYGWNLPVQDVVATGLHGTDLLLRVPTAVQIARVGKILSACGLQHLARRKFLALSYGEKRLALLARALVQDPDWLLLDEFYNGLDRNYRRRLDSLLRDVRRRGQSWVATAHRLADVPAGTHFALALAGGRVLYRKPLDRHELESLASRASETAGPASPPAPPRSRSKSPAPRSRSLEPSTNALLIALRDVDLYVEYRAVLRHVNWRLQRGEHWAVFGANGAGKSSFLKLLYGDLAPALGGRIERIGCAPGMPMAEWKRRIGLVSPELQTTYLVDVSVMEMVASARYSSIGLVDAMTRADERQALKWLDFFELTSLARRRPRELSYGQMRRALIARALATEPDILLLDEPLTGLDPANRASIKVLLRRLMRSGVSVIAAVHHPEDLPRGMTHALRLHNHRAQQIDLQSAT